MATNLLELLPLLTCMLLAFCWQQWLTHWIGHLLPAFIYSCFLTYSLHSGYGSCTQIQLSTQYAARVWCFCCVTQKDAKGKGKHISVHWYMQEIPVIKLPTHWMSLLFHRNSSMEYLSSVEGWQQRPLACSKLKISNCVCRNTVHLCSFCNWILYQGSPFHSNKKREHCQTFSCDDCGSADSESWKPASREAYSHYTQATCSHYYSLTLQLLEVISTQWMNITSLFKFA